MSIVVVVVVVGLQEIDNSNQIFKIVETRIRMLNLYQKHEKINVRKRMFHNELLYLKIVILE